jgi:hypothetical protein
MAHAMLSKLNMSRFASYFVISFVSLILVYYSTAWVVLRCSHDENAPNDDGFVVSVTDTVTSDGASLECLGSDYTESLAGPASSAEIDPLTNVGASLQSHGFDFASLAINGLRGAWLSAVFRNAVIVSFPIDPPPYLFLLVLRI